MRSENLAVGKLTDDGYLRFEWDVTEDGQTEHRAFEFRPENGNLLGIRAEAPDGSQSEAVLDLGLGAVSPRE